MKMTSGCATILPVFRTAMTMIVKGYREETCDLVKMVCISHQASRTVRLGGRRQIGGRHGTKGSRSERAH